MRESEVAAALKAREYTVLHRGWPDFLVRRPDGAVALVEVKHNGDQLHGNQAAVHEILETLGLTVTIVREPADLDALRFVAAQRPGSACSRSATTPRPAAARL